MSSQERHIYNCFFKKGRNQFNDIVSGGTLKYEYAHVFELLTRLRQVCDHPCLVFKKNDVVDGSSLDEAVLKFLDKRSKSSLQNRRGGNKMIEVPEEDEEEEKKEDGTGSAGAKPGLQTEFVRNTIEKLKNKELEACPVCLDDNLDPAITSCGHIFCKECLYRTFEAYGKCPYCQEKLEQDDILPIDIDEKVVDERNSLIDSDHANFKPSSKI